MIDLDLVSELEQIASDIMFLTWQMEALFEYMLNRKYD